MLDPQRYIDVFHFPIPLPQHSLERPPDLCVYSPRYHNTQYPKCQIFCCLLMAQGEKHVNPLRKVTPEHSARRPCLESCPVHS